MGFSQVNNDDSDDVCRIVLDEDITIYQVDSLKKSIDPLVSEYQSFDLDLSQVQELDSSGVQLLIALRNTAIAKNKKLNISAMSNSVAKIFDLYDIRSLFFSGVTQ